MTRLARVALADRSELESWLPVVWVVAVVVAWCVVSRPVVRRRLSSAASRMLGPSEGLRWSAIPVGARPLLPLAAQVEDLVVEAPRSWFPVCRACGVQRVPEGRLVCGVCVADLERELDEWARRAPGRGGW